MPFSSISCCISQLISSVTSASSGLLDVLRGKDLSLQRESAQGAYFGLHRLPHQESTIYLILPSVYHGGVSALPELHDSLPFSPVALAAPVFASQLLCLLLGAGAQRRAGNSLLHVTCYPPLFWAFTSILRKKLQSCKIFWDTRRALLLPCRASISPS